MKIANASVQMAATHQYQEQSRQRTSLTAWRDGGPRVELTTEQASTRESLSLSAHTASLTSLPPASSLPPAPAIPSAPAANSAPVEEAQDDTLNDPNMQALVQLIERLTGKKVRLWDGRALRAEAKAQETNATPNGSGQRQGWGVVYQASSSYRETEQTTFTAAAKVQTSDGRTIDVTVELNMSRQFAADSQVTLRAGDALKDPLVINFSGTAAQLTSTRFSFDIDSDGNNEQIAFVTPDSGFLALDRNGDGTINNGSELFGAASGNGFAELAQYDQDGNNWIDENDAVWSQLKVWSKDSNGNDQLTGLAERNVGAIYLGNTATPFQLKDNGNTLQGAVRSSGIYLQESGGAGTLQQVDLVV